MGKVSITVKTTPISLEAYRLLHEGTIALGHVEQMGLHIDIDYCESKAAHLSRQIKRLEKELQESELISVWKEAYGSKFNMKSPEQLANVLYNPKHMDIEPLSFTDGECNKCKGKKSTCEFCRGSGQNPSVDEEALEATGVDDLKTLVRIRKLYKMKDTYILGFLREQVDGVVHQIFNLNIARTYRPSTEAPNLANVPKRDPEAQKICRRAIKARPGHKILSADFKGIEVAIACCYNKDPQLIKYVSDKKTDMHRDMAMQLYMLPQTDVNKHIRHSSKNQFVFPEFYGDYWRNCADALWVSAHKETHVLSSGMGLVEHLNKKDICSLEDFEEHVRKVEKHFWNKRFKVYTEWKEDWREAYYERGYFDSLTGFRYQGVMDRNQIINYPIQGSAFHCLLQCLIWIDEDSKKENWDSKVCNQIYDDIMIDLHPKEEKMVRDRIKLYMTERLPEFWKWIIVPLEVEIETSPINGSWYDKEAA